ncbi:ABC transporter permease [Parabacteroides bouchesdurhonensis]|uniref:ABC transporter permease n=1 Tax=Parabacteroides bouchesdurhonensis TaxID=1936995 RepID=UPI001D0BF8EF|nr:ABC transporter permease [Parabacteroides bouchesdurhonensis]
MWKYKTQSFTGIFGLAFGLACFVPALYWLRYETSYDSFYPNSDHIYRIYSFDKQTGKTNDLVSGILERKLHEQIPATQTSTVFFIEQNDCKTEDSQYIRLHTIFADNTFFNVFPQVTVSGDAQQPLQVTNNIVISETVAMHLFGDVEKAIGQQIKSTLFDWHPPYTVAAVVKDPPSNSNVSFDAILYIDDLQKQKSYIESSVKQIWAFALLQMYVKLPPHTDIDNLAKQLCDFPLKLDKNAKIELRMMPVSNIRYHLNADVPFTLNFIRLLVVASMLLLFSALFNFLSLHLDLFRQRIRELHLRAVNGASCGQLIRQMIVELACAILLVLLPACYFVVIASPAFSKLLDIKIEMLQLIYIFIVCGISVMMLMLLAALIPFWRLSRIAMQNLSKRQKHRQPILRRLAVIIQLAVSVIFIIATLVVMKQMYFVNHKDLGFERNGIIHLSGLSWYTNNEALTVLKNKLASIPQIENITDTYFEPQYNANAESMIMDLEWPGKLQSEKPAFCVIVTDSKFAETFKINILQGEWINEGGEHQVVLNEEAVRVMRLNEPIGTVIRQTTFNFNKEYRVVGIVKDFHLFSLRSRIHPMIFVLPNGPTNSLYVRTTPGKEQEVIQQINEILPEIDPSLLYVYPTQLNELYDRLNTSEQIGLKIFFILATVCLLISLFGIYAVASAATRRRRKEVAIHKVMGADSRDIIRMFFKEYIIQVLIAGAFALPLAYLAMNKWLQGYAYRISIPLWLLAGAITGVVAVVLLTVLGQVLKAANSNPVEVVKSE